MLRCGGRVGGHAGRAGAGLPEIRRTAGTFGAAWVGTPNAPNKLSLGASDNSPTLVSSRPLVSRVREFPHAWVEGEPGSWQVGENSYPGGAVGEGLAAA